MKKSRISFENTGGFSKIFLDYVRGDQKLASFYNQPPSLDGMIKHLKSRSFEVVKRKILVETLKEQYSKLIITDTVASNINLLAQENTFTITTGHQLNVYTGPLFFIYKIISAINTCIELKERHPKHNFIPIYWMASEDHDFEEIQSFFLGDKKFTWDTSQKGPVGRFSTENIKSEFLNSIPEKVSLFEEAYLRNTKLADACRQYTNDLFGEFGLVVVDADHPRLKNTFRPVIEDDLINNKANTAIGDTNKALGSIGYRTQAFARDINFFYLKTGLRSRVECKDSTYKVLETGQVFSLDELRKEIQKHPERFSPNVIMRPLYQESILPNIGYLGGPGELAYWLQLKKMFDHYKIDFPVLLPRNFVLVLNKNIQRKIKSLGFDSSDFFKKEHDLKRKWVKANNQEDELHEELGKIQDAYQGLKEKASKTDPTLIPYLEAEMCRAEKRIIHTKNKFMKARQRNNKISMQQVNYVKQAFFPDGLPQERRASFLDFYLPDKNFIKKLKKELNPFDLSYHVLEL